MTLRAMATLGPVMVVLLPALGRATAWLKAVRDARPRLEGEGLRLVLVHMEPEEVARALLESFDLHYLARIADPERALYAHFGLGSAKRMLGSARQLPGWVRLEGDEVVDAERPAWDQKAPLRLIESNGPNRSAT